MIVLENLCKAFRVNQTTTVVADGLSMAFPSGKTIAVMGKNGVGKSTLLKLIAGSLDPDAGQVIRHGSVSWPVGFQGALHKEMSAAQNVRFVGRVYGVDTDELINFVQDFAQLGRQFYLPVKTYSSGMRSRLSFGLSMGIPFDTYLVDEVSSVGDGAFKARAAALLDDRLTKKGAIVVTHSKKLIRRICDAACILENGRLGYFEDVDEAIKRHRRALRQGGPAL